MTPPVAFRTTAPNEPRIEKYSVDSALRDFLGNRADQKTAMKKNVCKPIRESVFRPAGLPISSVVSNVVFACAEDKITFFDLSS